MKAAATRLSIAGQVVLLLLLAAVGASLLIHVSQRRPLRVRVDLTLDARNTLSDRTLELLAALPEEAEVDVFLRPETAPLDRVWIEASGLVRELLTLAESEAPDKLDVTFWNVLGDLENVQARALELGIREDQVIVVSVGDRRAVIRLWEDVAEVDPGSTDPRNPVPPTLHRFRGEEALVEALVKVSTADRPRAYFTTGHAEPSPFEAGPESTTRFAAGLQQEGFEIATWDPASAGAIPDDCALLCVLAPDQPLRDEVVDAIVAWAEEGGRLFVAASGRLVDEPGSTGDLLARLGMPIAHGIVSVPYRDPFTNSYRDCSTLCAEFPVDGAGMNADHPITAPLIEDGYRVAHLMSRSFGRLQGTGARAVLPLLHSPPYAWRDLPGEDGLPDFCLEPDREETGRFALAALARLTPTVGPRVDPETGQTLEGRVVAVACHNLVRDHYWASNRPFLLNAASWLVDRDLRIHLPPPPSREDPTIDVVRGTELATVQGVLWGLPGLSVALGVFVFIWRRRD